MSLLHACERRRSRPPGGWLRRHQGHPSEGTGSPPRLAGAARGKSSQRGRLLGRGGRADAPFRRRDGPRGRARGLPGDRERRRRRRADDLPSALARPRRRHTRGVRMSLIARIEDELKDAMRARDSQRAGTLRLTLASLRSAEKELQRPLHDDEELQVLQRERKRRAEAAEAFRAAGRDEQADKEELEHSIIEEFMPEPIDEDELEQIVDNAIAETGATSIRDLGRVMADVMPQVSGR